MNEYRSTKLFKGYNLHSDSGEQNILIVNLYMVIMEFKVTFTGALDQLNWVCDFGSFKRNGIKEHLSYMFDHTTVVAKDDPQLEYFKQLSHKNLIQLRVINDVGCEKFNKYVFDHINEIVNKESKGRVRVLMVECFEGGTDNSAIYKPIKISNSVRVLNYNKETI